MSFPQDGGASSKAQQVDLLLHASSSRESSHNPDPDWDPSWDQEMEMLASMSGTDASAGDSFHPERTSNEQHPAVDFAPNTAMPPTLPSHLKGNAGSLWGVEPNALLSNMLSEQQGPPRHPAPPATGMPLHKARNSNTPPQQLSSGAGSRTLGPDPQALQNIHGHGFMQEWAAADATSVQAQDWAAFPNPSGPALAQHGAPSAPNAALCFPVSLPSKQELELVRLLARSRRQLEQLLGSKQEKGTTGAIRRKAAEGVQAMQRLVAALEAEVAQHQRLQSRWRQVSMQLALAEQEQRWMQLDAAHGHAPLAVSARLLATGQGGYSSKTRALGSGALVSVFQLPRTAAEWDVAWDDCVRRLGVLDLLHLHRQWLQRSALLLPKARVLKGTPEGDAAKAELEELYERHNCFTQRVLRLAPDAWNESCKYDLDTMDLLPQSPNKAYIDKWASCHFPEEWDVAREILQTYGKVLKDLHQESEVLKARYAALSARPSCVVADLSGTGAGGGCSSEDTATADDVLKLLQANIAQQELQHNNCIHAVTYMQPIEVMVNIKLTVYPLALNGQELL